jgi:hypothetical protein
MKKISVLTFLFAATLCSCKKDKEVSKQEHLQNGKWKLTKFSLSGMGDMLGELNDCQKDNLYIFESSKVITVDEGATKCRATDPQTNIDGSWYLSDNDQNLNISGNSLFTTVSGKIITLNAQTLEISKDTNVMGFPIVAIISFTNVK